MRVIIIDDSKEYMALVRRMLASVIHDIEVSEYDPEQQGRPGPDFAWDLYDVVLLDNHLGPSGELGLDWLLDFAKIPNFPPIILMTAFGDEYVATRAIKSGAFDYVRKSDVSRERLASLVKAAVADGHAGDNTGSGTAEDRLHRDARLFQSLAVGNNPDGSAIGYRFIRLIGQGASSRVYLGESLTSRQTMVLKIIDVASIRDPQVLQRFEREAEIIAELNSPYVVHFLEHGFTEEYGYIAMEFFTRGDLKQRLEHGVPVADALLYFLHICYGLKTIHAHGIVHRDLKPGNIMFRADDSLALSDFGISKRLNETNELTKLGSVLGTPNYLSPEQALGNPVDFRADFYSAGVILFEMLTGRKPYRADSAAALVYQHVHADIPQLPEPVAAFQPVLNKLLAKLPADRYSDADSIIRDITPLQERFASY
ncbi:MAG: protein kinase [Gammaproteobacteria bacterium]|nr:protein kinase [Gammaproteobacteria bacterium]